MRRLLFTAGCVLCFINSVSADQTGIIGALKEKYPLGGFSVVGEEISGIKFHPDFFVHGYITPTIAQIEVFVGAYQEITNVKIRKLTGIKAESVERFKGYELYADMQSVIDYKAALRAVPTTAQMEMAALPDVASVKNYQPTWPTKPVL